MLQKIAIVILISYLRRVCGVDAAGEAPGKDGSGLRDEPLWRVEAEDADGVVPLQAELDEGLGDGARVRVVLLVRPLQPLPAPLHGQGGLVRVGAC